MERAEIQEDEKLEKAVALIEKLESDYDIFTLNKAIAAILERRARMKPIWQDWLSKQFRDVESNTIPKDSIHPLLPDLS